MSTKVSNRFSNVFRQLCLMLLLLAATIVHAAEQKIMVLGDSLSASYGIDPEQGWVHLLDQKLRKQYPGWQVINNSISGDTTGNGLARIDGSLALHKPSIVIIELGGNDALRGMPLPLIKQQLRELVERAERTGAEVYLMEMRIPPNMGKRYTDQFTALYSEVANETSATLIPFFLNEIAVDKAMMQADGIHPTAQAQPLMMKLVLEALEPKLKNKT